MSLTTYKQIVNSEVIVILRSFSPPHPNGGQSNVLKAVFFRVSLTVFPFALLFLVILFPLPAQPVLSQVGS